MEKISIGAGIFYGLLVLSFVILIIKTKDRWKWGRIFTGIIGLPIITVGVILGFEHYRHMPKSTLEFAGLTLNMPVDEVAYLKGEPEVIETTPPFDRVLAYPLDGDEASRLFLTCSDGVISGIIVAGYSNFLYPLYGVLLGSEHETVINKLGQPSQTEAHTNVYRSLYYEQYNIIVGTSKGKVIYLGIALSPEEHGWFGNINR